MPGKHMPVFKIIIVTSLEGYIVQEIYFGPILLKLVGNLKQVECLFCILSIHSLSSMISAGCNDVKPSVHGIAAEEPSLCKQVHLVMAQYL